MKLWFQHESLPVTDAANGASGQAAVSTERKFFFSRRSMLLVIIIFCTFEILDAVFTWWAVNRGLVWEGNHLIGLMAGNWSFIFLKFAGAVLSGVILQKIHEHFPKTALAAAISIALFYGAVLIWNYSMIFSLLLHR